MTSKNVVLKNKHFQNKMFIDITVADVQF